MLDLTLLRSDHLWAIAHDNHISLFWDSRQIHPVGQPLPPAADWKPVASGPAVLEFIKELGIFAQMVEMVGQVVDKHHKPRKLSPWWPCGY